SQARVGQPVSGSPMPQHKSANKRRTIIMPDKLILPQGCGLLSFPTPLCRMDGVSSDLGCEVFVKRDDLTGIGFGGNKLRKLDYLIADARQKNCRMLVTSGSLQTNHGMLTAICAAKTGLH